MTYTADNIRLLEGLEPVKLRPGMYTHTDSPQHVIQEVLDNAADEALGGYANRINVILHADGSVSIADNGRGIPVENHSKKNVPTVQLVFTELHAGGKFDKKDGGAYAFSGGLHGVGVSVTNALAARLEVEVAREGQRHRIVFADGGVVAEPLRLIGPVRGHGTRVQVWPDPKYFDTPNISVPHFERVLRSKAILLPGLTVKFSNEKTGESKEWMYKDGLVDYLAEALHQDDAILVKGQWYAECEDDAFSKGEGADFVLAFTETSATVRESFVNLIQTPQGGTHDGGLREAAFAAVKNFMEMHSLMPKGVKLTQDDVVSHLSYLLSARMLDPQFQGQTKERLSSRDAGKLVQAAARPLLEHWLNRNVDVAKRISEWVARSAVDRARQGQRVERRKSTGAAVLPGKLTDCESSDLDRNEILLVEGDSAGGSAKQGRDKDFQAVLPLRGKVMNTYNVESERVLANAEIHDIAVALGVDPHDCVEKGDITKLRYGKVVLLTDADVDGSHIQVLLLTLLHKHFPALITAGRVYVGLPPLYRVDAPPQKGKKGDVRKLYALNDAELLGIQRKLTKEGVRPDQVQVSRFKGLGEMNPVQLWETTLNPDARRLVRIRPLLVEGATVLHMLMDKNEASSRREWLARRGNDIEGDI